MGYVVFWVAGLAVLLWYLPFPLNVLFAWIWWVMG